MLNRKESEVENMRLRKMYLTDSWSETNDARYDSFIDKFEGCMDGGLDSQWPRETFLADGLMRIEKKFLPELRKWIKQQQSLEGEEEEEEEEEEEDDDDEDDEDDDDDDDDDDDALMADGN